MAEFLKTVTVLDLSGNPGLTFGVERGSIYFNGHFYSRKVFNDALEHLDSVRKAESKERGRKIDLLFFRDKFDKQAKIIAGDLYLYVEGKGLIQSEKHVLERYGSLVAEDILRVLPETPRAFVKGPNWPDELG